MNENEFTGPDGTRYQAVDVEGSRYNGMVPCNGCALTDRPDGCPVPRLWPGEPRCTRSHRNDRRSIYWVVGESDPNPL